MTKTGQYLGLGAFGVVGAVLGWGAWHQTPGDNPAVLLGYVIGELLFLILLYVYVRRSGLWSDDGAGGAGSDANARPRLTREEFSRARGELQRQMSWVVVPWFVLWLGACLGIGIYFSHWFDRHPNVSLLFIGAGLVIFFVPMLLISQRLHERSGLVCPRCGFRGSVFGFCAKCHAAMYDDI